MNMSDPRRPDSGPEPTLDEIRRTDDFLDALAAGTPAATQDSADAALAAMLGGWRDEMRWPPDTGLISESDAVAALNAGLAEKPRGLVRDTSNVRQIDNAPSRRSRRGLSVVGAVAAAALCIGGFGAVVAGAGPGDALYGLRTMLFGTPKQVRDDQVALAARTEMQQVQQLITQGDWKQAQEKLVAVSTQVASVGDEEQKQELLDQFNDLSAKVVDRNPEATAAPGIVYTVPPSATDLVPVLAPTTTASASPTSVPSLSESTTAPTTPSSASGSSASESPASGSATTTPSAAPTTATSAAPTTATSAAPTTASSQSAAATTSAAPRTSTTASASTPTTTPTSAAPTTTAAATTAATTAATSAEATTTTAAPKAAATTATTTARAAETTAATTTAAPAATQGATTTAAPTAVTTTAAPATESASAASTAAPVTTTTVVPVPVG